MVTCADYRLEQLLVSLKRQLEQEELSLSRRCELEEEIRRLERELGLD